MDDEEITDKLGKTLTLETEIGEVHEQEDGDGDGEDEEEFEFSLQGREINSPVSAEEVFFNGQIRVTDPFSEATDSAPPVRKVFVVSSSDEDVVEGPYCVWSTEDEPPSSSSSENQSVVPEMSKKSNSTGFSRLRKMKDLLVRSNSDGKDTFVFLAGGKNVGKSKKETSEIEVSDVVAKLKKKGKGNESPDVARKKEEKKKKGKNPAMTAAYEALYGGKKEKKSYLPYKVGFFTNVNSMTKNVHPY